MDYSKIPIKECPHCGSNEGFYIKQQIYGKAHFRVKFDGNEGENGDLHDYLTYKDSKFTYCTSCNKKLFNLSILND